MKRTIEKIIDALIENHSNSDNGLYWHKKDWYYITIPERMRGLCSKKEMMSNNLGYHKEVLGFDYYVGASYKDGTYRCYFGHTEDEADVIIEFLSKDKKVESYMAEPTYIYREDEQPDNYKELPFSKN